MHILTPAIVIAFSVILAGCAPRGALTPEDAYYMLRKACHDGDGAGIEKLLSRQSLVRITTITRMLAGMEDRQAGPVARELGIPAENLKHLDVRDFLSLQLKIERESGGKVLWPLVSRRISRIIIRGDRAAIVTEGGAEMKLVREGPYWKFDQGLF
jgi:hypothetical protein